MTRRTLARTGVLALVANLSWTDPSGTLTCRAWARHHPRRQGFLCANNDTQAITGVVFHPTKPPCIFTGHFDETCLTLVGCAVDQTVCQEALP